MPVRPPLPAGTCLCHACGKLSTEIYFASGTQLNKFKLLRHPFGRFSVVRLSADGTPEDTVYEPVTRITGSSKIPTCITVRPRGGGQEIPLQRVCPYCREIKPLLPGQGEYPTYVVCMDGDTYAGKSSWIHAVNTGRNINLLQDVFEKENALTIEPVYLEGLRAKAQKTNLGDPGSSTIVHICRRHRPIASVMLIDIPGELTKMQNQSPHDLRGSFLVNSHAIFVIDDGTQDDKPVEVTYNTLQSFDPAQERPLAHIVTKFDQIPRDRTYYQNIGDLNFSMMTKDTFPSVSQNRNGNDEDYYSRGRLLPRLAVQNALVQQFRESGRTHLANRSHRAGFLVQSCAAIAAADNPDGTLAEDTSYETSVNVLDPLIWLLHQFDIISLTTT